MRIALDYVPEEQKTKRICYSIVAALFMLIGAFLFGLVTAQSIMDDVQGSQSATINNGTCF